MVVGERCVGANGKKLIKSCNKLQYVFDVIFMSQPHDSYPIWKLLIWILLYLIFEVRWSRGGAVEQNEQKPENGSRAPPSGSILINYTLKDRKLFANFLPNLSKTWPIQG